MKMKKMRLALYVLLACMLIASAVSMAYSKYVSSHSLGSFDIYVTAGTLNVNMLGGSSDDSRNLLIPGTYVNVAKGEEPIVQIEKNSEESYLFLTVAKSENIKDLVDVYTNNARCNAEEGYTDGVWLTLANNVVINQETGETIDILYRRVTKAELAERAAAETSAETGEGTDAGNYVSYPVLRKITAVTPGPLWVKPETGTASVAPGANITFTAYAVQVTLGIDDPVTAWNKLGVHPLGSNFKVADANCDQNGNVQYLYGAGTESDPYTISDKAELKYFAENATKVDYAGDYFKLTDSIKWSSFNGDIENLPESSNWTPIGTESAPFVGTFNGNGQTVSGIYCKGTTGLGLFNYAAGTVKNLTIDSSAFIASSNKVAPFVANMSDDPAQGLVVENCKNYATVQGSQYVSGIVSFINDPTKPEKGGQQLHVKNCINYGNITIIDGKHGYVGGVLAYAGYGNTLVEGCTNYGTITGGDVKGSDHAGGILGRSINGTAKITCCDNFGLILGDSLIGGIAGNVFDGTTIEYCYNAGAVVSVSNVKAAGVGGIVGRAQTGTTISNCIHAGEVRIAYTKSQRWGEIVGDCGLKLKPEFENQNQNQNQTEDENQQVDEEKYDPLFLNSDGVQVTISNCYFVPSANAGGYAASKNDAYAKSMGWIEGYATLEALAADMSSGTLSLDKWSATNENGNYTLTTPAGNLVTVTTPKYFVGEGTKTSPFLISVPDDLAFLANHHTDSQYSGKHFKLTNDVVWDNKAADFFSNPNITTTFTPPKGNTSNEKATIAWSPKIDFVANWTPIGTLSEPFVGTFDGDGHTVSGIYCEVTDFKTATGFFGAVNGTVKNLTIENSLIEGKRMVGAIVGYVRDGDTVTIENCVNYATVVGNSGVGGIFGGYFGSGSDGDGDGEAKDLLEPSKTGHVYITHCVNEGAIYCVGTGANSSVGGIAGSLRYMGESSIEYCVNSGNVTSAGGCVGGIVGQAVYCNFTMKNCINTGNVRGSRLVGGIIGKTAFVNKYPKTMENLINTGIVSATSTPTDTTPQFGPINGSDKGESGHENAFEHGTYYYLNTLTLPSTCYSCGTGENALYKAMSLKELKKLEGLDERIAAVIASIPDSQ